MLGRSREARSASSLASPDERIPMSAHGVTVVMTFTMRGVHGVPLTAEQKQARFASAVASTSIRSEF